MGTRTKEQIESELKGAKDTIAKAQEQVAKLEEEVKEQENVQRVPLRCKKIAYDIYADMRTALTMGVKDWDIKENTAYADGTYGGSKEFSATFTSNTSGIKYLIRKLVKA